MPRFLVYGTSTAAGLYDTEQGGWANRLNIQNMLDPSKPEFLNLSLPGLNVHQILDDLPRSIAYAQAQTRRRVFGIFQPGGSEVYWSVGSSQGISPEGFTEALQKIGAFCIANTNGPPIFVTLQPHEKTLPEEDPFFIDPLVREKYNDCIRDVARDNAYPLVDLTEVFAKEQGQNPHHNLYAHDGIHPNGLGHMLIAQAVSLEIDDLLQMHPVQYKEPDERALSANL